MLEGDQKSWKLVTVSENRHRGFAPAFCLRFLQSPFYHVLIIVVTLVNGFGKTGTVIYGQQSCIICIFYSHCQHQFPPHARSKAQGALFQIPKKAGNILHPLLRFGGCVQDFLLQFQRIYFENCPQIRTATGHFHYHPRTTN